MILNHVRLRWAPGPGAMVVSLDKLYYAQKLSAQRLRRVYEIAGPRLRQYLEAEIAFVNQRIRPGDRVLELGCGYGRATAKMADRAGEAWGVDNSLASLQLGKSLHPRLRLAVMDAAELGFADHSFDLTACVQNGVSAFKVDPARLLAECLRVTRPGGLVLLSSYAAEFWPHRLEWFRAQAAEGLLGRIDEEATGDGVIVGRDGFRAVTFAPEDFQALAASCGVRGRIAVVDRSSVFCEITAPGG